MADLFSSRSAKSFIVLSIFVSSTQQLQMEVQHKLLQMPCCASTISLEAYRLNQSGDLSVPPEATDEFCNGACLSETQGLLDCIDNFVSGFLFYNKATTQDIRDTLHSACSYSIQRGNFNVGEYIQRDTSDSLGLLKPARLRAFVLVICWMFFNPRMNKII
ncbi:hypothetical protein Vadar_011564 [Vaccinium darrowii]|uniref:Uncharacterized protein n=1 Tax=Vaccinium darrowii TaxID=229202 RepID=A0ACB7WZX6_9ERIC|nr:hypothetical protein Vadar_011564 [Vaccinium darrowii]